MPPSESPHVTLMPMDVEDLRRLTTSAVAEVRKRIPHGALPPPHVVARALSQFDAGTPALWCVPYLMVATGRGAIVGGCGFKGPPVDGRVEIGYSVVPPERRRGFATAAVAQLLELATAAGGVQQVVAHIVADNTASSNTVARLGFLKGDAIADADGECVVQWVYRLTV